MGVRALVQAVGRSTIGAISRAQADEKEYNKIIEVRVEAYAPTCREYVRARGGEQLAMHELRLRVETF